MKGEYVRVIEISNLEQSAKEIVRLGLSYSSAAKMSEGFISRVLKISEIDIREINIVRGEALRAGMSAAVADDALLLTAAKGELLICGTLLQYEMLIRNLGGAILNCPEIAIKIKRALYNFGEDNFDRVIKGRTFNFGDKSYVMGILNITEDSFSDGGKYINPETALERALKMVEEGADILDIGAESTRPGAIPVSEEEELARVIPVVEKLSKIVNVPISIDTYKSSVAKAALAAGADIINDITGLKGDGAMAEVVADRDAYVVIMHMQGTPQTMQSNPVYQNVVSDICADLKESLAIAEIEGIKHDKIIVDPGIGFGKTTQHNLEIIERLSEFKVMGYPILMGASRKSVIGSVLNLPVDQRVEGSLAIAAVSAMKGASIIRVHDVKETKRVLTMVDAIKNSIKE